MTEAEEAIQSILSGNDEESKTTSTQEPQPPVEEQKPPVDEPKTTEEPKPPVDESKTDDTIQQPTEEPPKKPSEHTPQERAEFAFRRQLAKQREKYEAQLKEQSDKFADLQKQLDALRSSTAPKPTKKARSEFKDDEDYLEYLAEERSKEQLEKLLADRDAKDAELRKQEAQKRQEEEDEARLVEETRNRFIALTDAAFNNDADRKTAFFKKVQYANEHGLGEILENNYASVAKDFFFNNPDGPLVFEKMLNDRPTLERIFNDRTASSPMEMFYELKQIASEVKTAPTPSGRQTTATPATQAPATPMQTVHIGKPGQQSSSNSAPDIFSDDEAMLNYLRSQY